MKELNIKRKIDKVTGKGEKKTSILLNLYISTNEELELLADRYGVKKSDIIRHALNDLLEKEEINTQKRGKK